jgi:hypothetical protein
VLLVCQHLLLPLPQNLTRMTTDQSTIVFPSFRFSRQNFYYYDYDHHNRQGRAPIVVASLAKTWKTNTGLSAAALSNDVGFRACLMPSANTVSNASALAKVGACVANGGSLGSTRLLSSEGVKKALQTTKSVFDESMGRLLTYTDCGKFRTPYNNLDTPHHTLASFAHIFPHVPHFQHSFCRQVGVPIDSLPAGLVGEAWAVRSLPGMPSSTRRSCMSPPVW